MTPEELDAWYDEQKQMLFEEMLKALEDKKEKDEVERLFNAKMKKLHAQYEKMFVKTKSQGVKKGITKFTAFMDKISEMYK